MKNSVFILGTKYRILKGDENKYPLLKKADGYCDCTSRKIVVATKSEDCEIENFEIYAKSVLRHEIIHAFLFESGLHLNSRHPAFGHDEEMIDWFAKQYPKIKKVYQELGIEE